MWINILTQKTMSITEKSKTNRRIYVHGLEDSILERCQFSPNVSIDFIQHIKNHNRF